MNNNDKYNNVHNEAPDIRRLCKSHVAEYICSGEYTLKRLIYDQLIMKKCDKYEKLGFDYILKNSISQKKR